MPPAVHPGLPPEDVEVAAAEAPPVHRCLYVSRGEGFLHVSELPEPAACRSLALALTFYNAILLAGAMMLWAYMAGVRASGPSTSLALLLLFGELFAFHALIGFCLEACWLTRKCAHEILEIGPEAITLRKNLWGLDFRTKSWSRATVTNLFLEVAGASSACVIVEGECQHKVCRRLSETTQRHVLALRSEFLRVPIGPDRVIILSE